MLDKPTSDTSVEELTDIVPHEALVRVAGERGRDLGAGLCAGRWHRDASVPVQHGFGMLEVRDLTEDALQVLERRG